MGEGGRSSVITVATAHSLSVVDPILRDRLTILRFEPPSAQELEKLLVRSVVGRYYLCDLDRISFQSLAEDASGLAPGRIEEAAKRAKLAALDRRARELGTRLFSSSARMRERIRESYLITQEDLRRALAEQKRAPGRVAAARPAGEDLASRPAEPWARQTDLWHWGAGPGGRSSDGRP